MKRLTQTSYSAFLVAMGMGLAAAMPASYANAQETQADNDDTIVVIGTRRAGRSVTDSNVPIDVIDAGSLEQVGFTDINRSLQNLVPSFNFPQPTLVDGTEHVKPASLRGLAPDQTLVLVNGRRRHPSALLNINGSAGRGSVSTDLNAIPASAIKRIEILRDGASAQYGSDAIGGVMNIVTKDADEGGSVSVSYGLHVTTLDGVPELLGIQVGADGYPVPTDGPFEGVAGIWGDDIERQDGETLTISYNHGIAFGDGGYANGTLEYTHANRTQRGGADVRDTYPNLPNGEFDLREITTNRDRFRYGNPEYESLIGLFSAGMPLSANAELYAMTSFQLRESTSAAFFREAADEGYGIQEIYPDGFTPLYHTDIQDNAVLAGVRGVVAGWDFDASLVYGRNAIEYTTSNTANVTYLLDTPTSFYGGEQQHNQLTANADFSRLIDMDNLASPLSLAFGFEFREENYTITAGEPSTYTNALLLDDDGNIVYDINGNPLYGDSLLPVGSHLFTQGGFYFSSNVDEGRDSVGAYIELDADMTDAWNVTVAGRFEDYSDFGDTFNAKVATRFDLTDTFALRASASTGFRAPSLIQQYFTKVDTNFIDGEPIDIGTIPATSPAAMALGGTQLQPEESTNFSIGATWTGIDNLTVTLDAYTIDIDDRIVLSETLGNDSDEAAIVADVFAANGIVGVGAARFFINGVNSTTDGVDLTLSYDMDLGDHGDINIAGGINWNKTDVSDVIATVGPASLFDPADLFARRERERLENAAPETKANIAATWTKNAWMAMLRTSYYGDITQPGTTESGDVSIDTAFIFDGELGYNFDNGVNVTFGANNIFDVYPESAVERNGGNPEASWSTALAPYAGFSPYGFQGRYVYGRIGYNF